MKAKAKTRGQLIKEVLESQRMLQALLNATRAAVFLLDTKGVILALNETMAKALDKSSNELLGTPISNYLPPEIAEARRESAFEVIRTGKPAHLEFKLFDMWLEQNIYPVFDEEGRISKLAIYSENITERKRAEHELAERASHAALGADVGTALTKGSTLREILQGMCSSHSKASRGRLCPNLDLQQRRPGA